jgi:hypothetical protein
MELAYIRNHGYTFPVRLVLNVVVHQNLPPFSPPVSRAVETVLIETQTPDGGLGGHVVTCTDIILLALAPTRVGATAVLATPSNMVVEEATGILDFRRQSRSQHGQIPADRYSS